MTRVARIQSLIEVIEAHKEQMIAIRVDDSLAFVERDEQIEALRATLRGSLVAYFELTEEFFKDVA